MKNTALVLGVLFASMAAQAATEPASSFGWALGSLDCSTQLKNAGEVVPVKVIVYVSMARPKKQALIGLTFTQGKTPPIILDSAITTSQADGKRLIQYDMAPLGVGSKAMRIVLNYDTLVGTAGNADGTETNEITCKKIQ